MQGAGQGVYGSIIIDENTGEWVYNLDAMRHRLQKQLFIERFTIEASDVLELMLQQLQSK